MPNGFSLTTTSSTAHSWSDPDASDNLRAQSADRTPEQRPSTAVPRARTFDNRTVAHVQSADPRVARILFPTSTSTTVQGSENPAPLVQRLPLHEGLRSASPLGSPRSRTPFDPAQLGENGYGTRAGDVDGAVTARNPKDVLPPPLDNADDMESDWDCATDEIVSFFGSAGSDSLSTPATPATPNSETLASWWRRQAFDPNSLDALPASPLAGLQDALLEADSDTETVVILRSDAGDSDQGN